MKLLRTRHFQAGAGALFAAVVAVALFTRFSLDDTLHRDEAIYVYGGQELLDGVPPYESIFDPKTPLATVLCAFGAAFAAGRGAEDVHPIRIVFFVVACLTVVAVYALGLAMWRSPVAAALGAVVLTAFPGFALATLGGPDAKAPGILLGTASMALMVHRHWFWGALAGSIAFLAWQPLGIYAVVAVAAAWATSERERRRAAALAAAACATIPIAAATLAVALAGALPAAIEATITFPLTGIRRDRAPAERIVDVIEAGYGRAAWLLAAGILALAAFAAIAIVRARGDQRRLLTDPRGWAMGASLLPLLALSLRDFQGYPDAYPFLPYAAVGVAGVAAAALAFARALGRGALSTAAVIAATATLAGAGWASYSHSRARDTKLVDQRAEAAAIERLLDRGEEVWAMGDPRPLVLTGRRNPSRFIYLGSGVAAWAIQRHFSRFPGFAARLRARDPAIVVVRSWQTPVSRRTERWLLASGYRARCHGRWPLYLKPSVLSRAAPRAARLESFC